MENENFDISQGTEVETTATAPEENQNAAEDTVSSTVSEETNVDEKANPRNYTKEEQAAYSFRKQLAKQKAKYENNYVKREQYDELLKRLERLENPEAYAPKTRDQFKSDDEFIDHLVEQKFNTVWNQRLQEAQNSMAAKEKANQEINAYRTKADENVKKLFKTPEAEKQYRDTIANALQQGLGDRVDSDKETAMYIMRSEMGPKILYELATKPELVEKLFNENVTDLDRQFMIRELEANIRKEIATPVQPVVGKPGIQTQTTRGSIFDSDDSILNYLRSH